MVGWVKCKYNPWMSGLLKSSFFSITVVLTGNPWYGEITLILLLFEYGKTMG